MRRNSSGILSSSGETIIKTSNPYLLSLVAVVFIAVMGSQIPALADEAKSLENKSSSADEWMPFTGAEKLRAFMSGTTVEQKLPNGEISRGEYRSDGTGTLHSWEASFPRTWAVKGNDQICITARGITQCYRLERNTADPALFRALDVTTGRLAEFRMIDGRGIVKDSAKDVGDEGSTATASADEIAAQLANPNTPMASLNFKFQYRTFKGDLPNADDQDSTTLLFQPSLPFPLDNGDLILFRPAFPILFDQPVFNPASLDFDSEFGLGDISFDLAYASTNKKTGLLLAAGIFSTLPTATKSELGKQRWALGPEFFIGKITKEYVLGVFPNHQWDVAGSGEADINLTTMQLLGTYLPGGGWNVGTTPIMSYDHVIDEWSIPLNLTFGKTVIIGGRPWKFAMEINYFVEQPDAFGPEWFIGFNVTPVVENALANWFK